MLVLYSSELAAMGTTPYAFLFETPVGEQQRIAAVIMANRGQSMTARRLLSHDPALTQFVVESDNAAT